MPQSPVIPVLHDADVPACAAWLCAAFGFTERLRIGSHRIQLNTGFDGGALVVAEGAAPALAQPAAMSLMLRIADADAHHARALAHGAAILAPPTTHVYGERQYSARDPAGRVWTFSQTVADVDPASWGGVLVGESP